MDPAVGISLAAVSASVSIISFVIAGLDTTSSVMTMLSPSDELKSIISSASFFLKASLPVKTKLSAPSPPLRLSLPLPRQGQRQP